MRCGRKKKRDLFAALLLPFFILVALLNLFNYSVGVRTGVIGKLSRKGVACWTTEEQLALPNFARSGSLRGAGQGVDNTFYFSVPDADVRNSSKPFPTAARSRSNIVRSFSLWTGRSPSL
jgi:hypothetical protein